ncbi:hypothetical protein Pint_31642 [Pistacia integerrima]|uniref:Uncharacterized protein n=1 Tax=Pistacia integerrima TaxID=434235 RepID=A0ACC0XT13_9ROSI|nr:hypothetical protein Pint_31642 [Pistacia integerrima]
MNNNAKRRKQICDIENGEDNIQEAKGKLELETKRLVLATLTTTPVLIKDIHAKDTWSGLCPHEVSLLRLLEKVCDGCVVEINETGKKLKYKPGTVIGGRNVVYDCGVSRSIGYFLESLIVIDSLGCSQEAYFNMAQR